MSVSADLPRLDPTHPVFDIEEPLPAEFTIEAASTQRALKKVKCRKATEPDNIPSWMAKNYAHLLAAPVTAIFNSSLREGKLPDLWKTATVVPVPKKHPPGSLGSYTSRPLRLSANPMFREKKLDLRAYPQHYRRSKSCPTTR